MLMGSPCVDALSVPLAAAIGMRLRRGNAIPTAGQVAAGHAMSGGPHRIAMTEDIQGLLAELQELALQVVQQGDDLPLALACEQLREALSAWRRVGSLGL